ncbi:hypothetical protein SAY86_019988 [Trapa natans]|uniref:RRM domain-containing protein n=1 Tax=Trapa natans TaxID=22666 RepID=A0AAN7LPU5_TRANT|nr:hypothetical protein SAY86_019988 [Trapa natans]
MSASLGMSLDDITRSNRAPRSGPARYRGRQGTGSGRSRRFLDPHSYRATPYSLPRVRAPMMVREAEPHNQVLAGQDPAVDAATKIYVANLDYGVSDEDLRELFSEVGVLKSCGIHFDRSGRSKGTAEVNFTHRAEALAAVKRYNNVLLDGKPLKIELMGTDIVCPAAPFPPSAPLGNFSRASRWGSGRGGPLRRQWRGGGSSIGRGRGDTEKITAEDLDADLVQHLSKAMKIS